MKPSNTIRFGPGKAKGSDPLRIVGWVPLLSSVLAICASGLAPTGAGPLEVQNRPLQIIPVPHPLTSLLRAEAVHRELALSAAQIGDVEKAAGEVELPLWRLRDLPAKERNESADPFIQRLTERLSRTLSARQTERLNQIVWQAQGVEAVLEPGLAVRLSLSSEQLGRIGTELNKWRDRITSVQLNPGIRPESRKAAQIRKLRAEAEGSILAILNGRQRHLLTALTGRPFDFSRVRGLACKAPELDAETWLNSAPLKASDFRGKVTVVHFYAFGCGNCIRNLPHYNEWHKQFGADLQIVGIHTPETQRERDVVKVKEKAAEAGMDYPVAIDNERLCWDSWANRTWPSIYLVDRNGFVRYWWYGELNWAGAETEKLMRGRIQELMEEDS